MPLMQLPPELLLEIAFRIDSEKDLSSFVQVNRALYQTLVSELYRRNAKDSNGSAIRHGAESNNCSTLRKALQSWTDINGSAELPRSPDITKSTPLFAAAYRGNLATVKMLLEYGLDPNGRDKSNRTPLYAASGRGHTDVVRTLLEHPKIKVNAYDNDRITPICFAARRGHAEIVKILLSCGAHAGFVGKRGGYTPLHSAILNKQPELAALLVNREDVDPNALAEKSTPLQLAVSVNRQDLVEILLTDKRVDPDLNVNLHSRTPLFEAVLKNNEAIVNMLLSAGADPEIKDVTGFAPAVFLNAPSTEARYQLSRDHSSLIYKSLMQ
ncbi:ankyrin [Penicillium hetheringtonii]|uniref:Ankyrin n=1 Tax=Penicillium hetheringtonii TaxID=911720 RepID=A0AAD6D7S6_9EURO|nr:ankyrin [Penicillium hetheringtonii]